MIRSFGCKDAEALYLGHPTRRYGSVARVAQRKLMLLHAARRLEDLRAFPGNRLEALRGDRKGQHSMRINDQYRICFRWLDGDAFDVAVTDYH